MLDDFEVKNQIYEFLSPIYRRKQKISFWLGAGISKGSGLPAARELQNEILLRINMNKTNIATLENHNLPFEVFMGRLSDFIDVTELLSFFKSAEPVTPHQIIAEIVKMDHCGLILTTNFDLCIEKAINKISPEQWQNFIIFRDKTDIQANSLIGKDHKTIIKLHGSIDYPETIKTTLKKIANSEFMEYVGSAVVNFFNENDHELVFIMGYSFSDIFDVVPAVQSVNNNQKTVVWIDHCENDKELKIENLKDVTAGNPIDNLSGYKVHVNTDVFLQVLERLFSLNIPESSIPRADWKKYLKTHLTEIFRKDPSLQFTLCGQLMDMISKNKEALSYYQKALNSSKQLGLPFNIA